MSGQIINSYRWSDKPVALKQTILLIVIGLLVLILFIKYKGKKQSQGSVHPFTQGKQNRSTEETQREMEKYGILSSNSKTGEKLRGNSSSNQNSKQGVRIRERPLFDGLIATLEVRLNQPLSSTGEGTEVDATVQRIIPDEVLSDADGEIVKNARLLGEFQSNFETKRISFHFTELVTSDGRRLAVSGVAMDPSDSVLGVIADYSSGTASRVLGSALNQTITTGEQYGTSRILADPNNPDATLIAAMNRPISDTGKQAANAVGEELTKDLRSKKPVLSLNQNRKFLVKLKAALATEEHGP